MNLWNPYARGTVVGITRGCTKDHFIRAALEAIDYQVCDVITAMEEDSGIHLKSLKVDGGASANDFLMHEASFAIVVVLPTPVGPIKKIIFLRSSVSIPSGSPNFKIIF